MTKGELSVAIVFASMCVLGAVWWLIKLTDEPDPMDDAHGDVPEVPYE